MTLNGVAGSTPPLTSVNRALDVLEALAGDPGSSLTQLATRLKMPKATTRRLLINLMARGYVDQDPDSRAYRLGLRCWQLGAAAVGTLDVRIKAREELERVADSTGEQATLWVYSEGYAVCVDRVESRQPVRSYTQLGSREPAVLLSAGRCLLASRSATEVDRAVAEAVASGLIDDDRSAALAAHLAQVTERRFDISQGDRWPDMSACAAPIRDYRGVAVAAIGISGPSTRLVPDLLGEYALRLRDVADQLSGFDAADVRS